MFPYRNIHEESKITRTISNTPLEEVVSDAFKEARQDAINIAKLTKTSLVYADGDDIITVPHDKIDEYIAKQEAKRVKKKKVKPIIYTHEEAMEKWFKNKNIN